MMRPSGVTKPKLRFKIVLVGEVGVGKTSFFMRVKEDVFGCRPTIGTENCSKEVEVNGISVTFNLWDTAGLERFRTLTGGYYRGCQAVLMTYAIDDPTSMSALERWNSDIEHFARREDIIKVIVGNKADLPRRVTRRQVEDFADIYQCPLRAEVSAKSGDGIIDLLETLSRYFIQQMNSVGPLYRSSLSSEVTLTSGKPANYDSSGQKSCGC